MGWQDRQYDDDPHGRMGRPGGDWQGMRPTLDNPMTWSVTLMRVLRIVVRVHFVFLLFVIIELGRSLFAPHTADAAPLAFPLAALRVGALFTIVLLHEFGHCLACRRMRGEADEILMWPLGGLAYCRPPLDWRAHFVTAAGGPLVNVAFLVVLGPVLGVLTGAWWGVAIPNPFVYPAFLELASSGASPWWLHVLFMLHLVSWALLLFNLLPIFPLDGGRLVQALLWSKLGYVRSMRLAVYVGYFGAIALGIAGAVAKEFLLVAIAIFGGVTCYMTLKQLQWTQVEMGADGDLYAAAHWTASAAPAEEVEPSAAERRAERRRKREAEAAVTEQVEVDRILDKIRETGMSSLSTREKRLLERATREARDKDGGGNGAG